MKTPSYEDIRRRVERRYNRLFWLIFHIIMAVVTTGVVWAIDPTPQDGTPVLAVLWIGVLIGHGVKVYMDNLKDQAIERTWQHYYGDFDADDVEIKEKSKRFARLADETEVEIVEDDVLYESNSKGQRSTNR